ncbi:MAG: TonB-dependent receptor [Pseudomonadota bacterium]|nr:TonB-dependent receptor [Pseudomonadota bacterium]
MRFTTLCILFVNLSFMSGIATAEDAGAGQQIEEIIVTATHRDTALMDTPISIAAVTSEDIEQKGIVNMQTLYQSIPGLSYRTNSNTYNTVSIRGLTQPGEGGPTVGMYMDGVSVTDSNTGTGISQVVGSIFDLERIEVLKGPQGTLYGESTLGGAIRYISKQPDPSGFEYGAKAEYEQMDEADDPSFRINAMVNIPLTETLALRATAFVREKAGLMDVAPPRNEKDVNDQEEDGFRVKLAWYPTDRLTLAVSAHQTDTDYGGPGNASIGLGHYNNELTQPDFPNGGFAKVEIYAFNLDYEADWADIEFTSSRYERTIKFGEETTPRFGQAFVDAANGLIGLFAPELEGVNPIAATGGFGLFRRNAERDIQELRILSNSDSKWQWAGGLYYKQDEALNGANSPDEQALYLSLAPEYQYARPAVAELDAIFAPLFPPVTIDSTEEAIFGEVTYEFNDQWEILLGFRYTEIVKEASGFVEDVKDDFLSPKMTLTYRPVEDVMTYFSVTQGFRPGVVNTALPPLIVELAENGDQQRADYFTDRLTVDGDEVLAYELGVKATFWDGRARLTAALYHLDWEDTLTFQPLSELSGLVATIGQAYNDNIDGGAESQGAEIEIDLDLTPQWGLSIAYDNNWKAETKGVAAGQYAGTDGRIFIAPSGNRLPNAPKYSYSMTTDYDFNLGTSGWTGNARLDWYRLDSAFNRITNEVQAPGYHQLDARVSLFSPDLKWRLSLFGANLDDEEVTYECNEVGCSYGRPFTIGASVSYGLD